MISLARDSTAMNENVTATASADSTSRTSPASAGYRFRGELPLAAVVLDRGQHAIGMRLQPDQPRRALDLAALAVQVVEQDRLADLLGQAEVEPEAAPATGQVDLAEQPAGRVDRAPRCGTPAARNVSAMPTASKTSSDRGWMTVA